MSKILYISSEAFPLIKTGGLADVAGSLPPALLKKQQDVRLFIPAYRGVLENIKSHKLVASTRYYNLPVSIIETRLPGTMLPVWLLHCPALFDRPGGPYSDEHGNAWHDNALRFSVFCHAAVDLALDALGLDWQAELVHCNDWQSGLVPALLSLQAEPPKTVFTIHNLAYQGIFSHQTFVDLHLPNQLWHIDGVEFYGQFSFIKGGLAYADKITTVSPSYASEICTDEHGYGLQGLLTHRSDDLSGILNGIDDKYWNPGTDNHIYHKYNRRSLEKKSLNKISLQKQYKLEVDENVALIGMVSRLVEQKGLEIILQSIPQLMELPVQIFILGTGDTHYEIQLAEWAEKFPGRINVAIGYNEQLAHRIEAASDIYMMPSRFEPCGLNQLYSLRYATLPVVTPVGGLADSISDSDDITATADELKLLQTNGFVLKEHTAEELVSSIERALVFFKAKDKWRQLQINAMSCDHSWQVSADHYLKLYKDLLE